MIGTQDSEEVDDDYLMPTEKDFFVLPMLDDLGRQPYHLVALVGTFKLKALASDYRTNLVRSEALLSPKGKPVLVRMLFSLGNRTYGHYENGIMRVYAPTLALAASAAVDFRRYMNAPPPERPGFYLLRTDGQEPRTEFIQAKRMVKMDDQALALHYGPTLPAWVQDWLARLAERCSGVSVLYGPPGCGKTTFVRALMSKLADKFVFYYLPVGDFELLSNPQFVGFWLRQTERHRNQQKIVILEDAESLLAPRSESIRAQVSDLLNVADGFLGDHLQLHIIATTNVPIRELDPAVTRPGRLLGAREFPRLSRDAALRLAEVKGIHVLPEQQDYSLAEIYCHAPNSCQLPQARRFGFA
jgi:hypothetical protein